MAAEFQTKHLDSEVKMSKNLAQNTDFWVAHRQNACVSMQNRGQTSVKQAAGWLTAF